MGGGPAKEHILCLLPYPEPKEIVQSLRQKFPDIDITYHEVRFSLDAEQQQQDLAKLPKSIWHDITILYTLFSLPAQLADVPNLRLVQLASAGSNQVQNHPIYTDSEIPIATASGIHGPQIAEWCVMTALVQSHKYNQLHDLQKQHKWGDKKPTADDFHNVHDMVGRRLGVLGYGSIGRQVGRVAKA
ncbi:hypothetical protein KC334_g15268, partial [Hortaea werneckii]